jgi:hypothetical protein
MIIIEEFMRDKTAILYLLLFLLINITSCFKENKETENQDDYNDIIVFLEENRDYICKTVSTKEIMALHLRDEEVEFYNHRLTYFINILKEDETNKRKYFEEHEYFRNKFRDDSLQDKKEIWAFYWSIDIFDYRLFDFLEKNFVNVKFPVNYIKDYKMNYWMMVNYDILKDKK